MRRDGGTVGERLAARLGIVWAPPGSAWVLRAGGHRNRLRVPGLVIVVRIPAPLAATLVALFLRARGGLLLRLGLALGARGAAAPLVALRQGAGQGGVEAR